MSRIVRNLSMVGALLLVASGLQGQVPPADLTGSWSLEATGQLPDENEPCVFQGFAEINQDGSQLFGQATLFLVSGPAACPDTMSAQLQEAGLEGPDFVFGLLDGGEQFGVLSFDGDRTASFTGTYSVSAGPFSGVTGTWFAQQSVLAIPTLTAVGLTVLVILLLGTGAFLLHRHSMG